MHLHLTFSLGKSADSPSQTPLEKENFTLYFKYAIEMSMEIDFFYKHFVIQAFNLAFQSRKRFHRKNDYFTVVAKITAMFKITRLRVVNRSRLDTDYVRCRYGVVTNA